MNVSQVMDFDLFNSFPVDSLAHTYVNSVVEERQQSLMDFQPQTGAISLNSGEMTLSSLESHLLNLQSKIMDVLDAQKSENLNVSSLSELLRQMDESEMAYDLRHYAGLLVDVQTRTNNTNELVSSLIERLGILQRKIARAVYAKKSAIKNNEVPAAPTL